MWYNYKQSIEMFWQEKADELFEKNNISKWRVVMSEEERSDKDYRKMSESAHGKALHKYLKWLNIKHTHIGNESWQMWTKNIIIMMAKKKAQWVSKWYPDYHILLKKPDRNISVHIELKKAKWVKWWLNWSVVSEEQLDWIKELNKVKDWHAKICHWYKEAIQFINEVDSLPTQ